MMTVAFVLDVGDGWVGGLNYYRNLLAAVVRYASNEIKVKVFVSDRQDMSVYQDFPKGIDFVPLSIFDRWTLGWFVRKVFIKIFGYDKVLDYYLKKYDVDVLSHVATPARCPGVKNIAWIPDFQHKYLPQFFSESELKLRDLCYAGIARNMDLIIFSSNAAKEDFITYYPGYESKARVLHFVPDIDVSLPTVNKAVMEKYGIKDRFFFLPNQYWAHKNHKIVLEALRILKDQNKFVRVVSTGNTKDYRAPHYIEELMSFIHEHQLEDMYIILGLIPYADVQALAAASWGYINPSFFEGWSTTVEEAKYRGKRILLSDLKVHREQAPWRGVFFDPNDSEVLAKKMWDMWQQPQPNEDVDVLRRGNEEALQQFAKDYCDIVKSS